MRYLVGVNRPLARNVIREKGGFFSFFFLSLENYRKLELGMAGDLFEIDHLRRTFFVHQQRVFHAFT